MIAAGMFHLHHRDCGCKGMGSQGLAPAGHHGLHSGILPFQVLEYPVEVLDSGDFAGAEVV